MLAAVFLVIVVAAVAVQDDRSTAAYEPNEQDVVGQWYLVDCVSYTSSGSYARFGIEDVRSTGYLLNIFDQTDGLFYGNYLDQAVTGSCRDGYFAMRCTDADNSVVTLQGWLEASDLLMVAQVTHRTDGATVAAFDLYSKDELAAERIPASSYDLAGSWQSMSDQLYRTIGSDAGVTEQAIDSKLTLVQNGPVFAGVMDDQNAATDVLEVAGAVLPNGPQSRDGRVVGFFYDAEDRYWTLEYHQGTLTCVQMAADGDAVSAEVRDYTRGGQKAAGSTVAVDLVGSSWTCTEQDSQYSNIHLRAQELYEITVTHQYGSLVFGTLENYGGTYRIAAVIQGGQPVLITYFINYLNETMFDYAVISADKQTAFAVSPFSWYTIDYALELRNDAAAEQWIGHWFVATVGGQDAQGVYHEYYYDCPERIAFRLDVYTVSDGTFTGFFRGNAVTGTIANGLLSFDLVTDAGACHVECSHHNSQQLYLAESCSFADGSSAHWFAIMSSRYLDYGRLPAGSGQ